MKYQELNWKKYIKYSYLVKNRWDCIKYLDKKLYQTKEKIIFWLDYNNKNEYIIIPKDYIFNFNSVPCIWECVVWTDEFMIALVHDFLCWTAWKINVIDIDNLSSSFKFIMNGTWFNLETWSYNYSRKMADRIWRIWAIEEAINIWEYNPTIRVYVAYGVLRLLGWTQYKKEY